MFISKHLKCALGFSISGILLLTGVLVFVYVGQDPIINSVIKNTVVLKKGSEVWERFVEIPFPFYFRVFMFHVENALEVLEYGETPIVTELGPYYFNQTRSKVIYESDSDDVVTFRESQFYVYDEELSGGRSLDDRAYILNPTFFGIMQALESIDLNLPVDLEGGVKTMFDEPYVFFNATMRELMFEGYRFCDPNKTDSIGKILCLLLMVVQQKNMIFNEDLSITFSFFNYKNDTDYGLFSMNSGVSDISDIGSLFSWENKTYTSYWKGNDSECNSIEGKYLQVFPPFLDYSTTFDVYSTDICKSANVKFSSETKYKDVEAYRFGTHENTFTSDDDDCHCIEDSRDLYGNETCFERGLLNLYTCFSAPILLSFPHFLGLNDSITDTVVGLNASEEKHSTYVDINPYLGIPLRVTQKIQFSIILRPFTFGNGTTIGITQNTSRTLTPIVWIDEGMALPDDLVNEIKTELYDRLFLLNVVSWVLISLSIALIVIPSVYFLIYKTLIQKAVVIQSPAEIKK